MAGIVTAEKLVIANPADNYGYTAEQRTLAASARTIVPVSSPTEAASIIAAMAADGRTVSATNPLVTWDDSLKTIITYTGASYPFGKLDYAALRNTNNTFATGNFTVCTFSTLHEDSNGLTAAVPTDRITIKKAGRYLITGGGGFNTGGNRIAVKLQVNGVDVPYGGQLVPGNVAEGGAKASVALNLAVNDYVRVLLFHEQGSAQNGDNGSPYGAPHLSVQQLSFA